MKPFFQNSLIHKLNYQSSKIEISSCINRDDEKIRVNIFSGASFDEIKLESGGGSRVLFLNNNDNYETVFKKLINLYFPSKSFILFMLSLPFLTFLD